MDFEDRAPFQKQESVARLFWCGQPPSDPRFYVNFVCCQSSIGRLWLLKFRRGMARVHISSSFVRLWRAYSNYWVWVAFWKSCWTHLDVSCASCGYWLWIVVWAGSVCANRGIFRNIEDRWCYLDLGLSSSCCIVGTWDNWAAKPCHMFFTCCHMFPGGLIRRVWLIQITSVANALRSTNLGTQRWLLSIIFASSTHWVGSRKFLSTPFFFFMSGVYVVYGIDAEIEACLCTCLLVTVWGIMYYMASTVQPVPVSGVEGGSWYHVNVTCVGCVGVALPGVGLVLEHVTRSTSPPPLWWWGLGGYIESRMRIEHACRIYTIRVERLQ